MAEDWQAVLDKVTRVLPATVLVGFHLIASQITPDSTCTKPAQRPVFITFLVVFSLISAVCAIVDRYTMPGRIVEANKAAVAANNRVHSQVNNPANMAADLAIPLNAPVPPAAVQVAWYELLLRGVLALLTFASVAILTPPGPTCLFQDGTDGFTRYLTLGFCITFIVIYAALGATLPGFASTVTTGSG